MLTGWQEIDGERYYFKSTNGIRYDSCFLTLSGHRYYFLSDGKLCTGKWFSKNGSRYYAQPNGVLATGWLKLNNKKYYLNPSTGARETGWVTIRGKQYYFSPSTGAMAVRQWIDKNNYVGDDGALIPDYQKVSFRWPLKGY